MAFPDSYGVDALRRVDDTLEDLLRGLFLTTGHAVEEREELRTALGGTCEHNLAITPIAGRSTSSSSSASGRMATIERLKKVVANLDALPQRA